jgi:transforming growth factor-beta-induced protein
MCVLAHIHHIINYSSIDQVMLPKLAEDLLSTESTPSEAPAPVAAPVAVEAPVAPTSCQTIAEIACGTEDFSTLCDLVVEYGLADALSDGNWTVFAPINAAFEVIEDTVATLSNETITDVLLFHAVADDVLFSDELECSALLTMANGKDSRTKCDDDGSIFQSGGDNLEGLEPEVIDVDIVACNGVVHIVNNVMLPGGTLP